MIVKLTIDRFENDKAVLITENGQSIIWPKNQLPEEMHEGQALEFFISTDLNTEAKNRHLAKDILNEILDTGHEQNPD
jgi:predicted RNA-binding protein (virulence factor B family)